MRIYDPRIGRFLSEDPITAEYPELTPYQYASNTPIQAIDLDGLEGLRKTGTTTTGRGARTRVMTDVEVMARNTGMRIREGTRILEYRARQQELARQNRLGIREIMRRLERALKDYMGGVLKRAEAEFAPSGSIVKPPREITDAQRAAVLGSQGLVKIRTPYDIAEQGISKEAIEALNKAQSGATLYRIGTLNKSEAAEAQFWSLENPLANPQAFSKKYGIPLENIKNANFIETATLKRGQPVVTRQAPPAPGNPNTGGGIEIVVNPGGVQMETFQTLPQINLKK